MKTIRNLHPLKTLILVTGLAASVQAFAATATSFDADTLITTSGQTVDGYTVTLDAADANLVVGVPQTVTNATLTGWANDGNDFGIDRVRFNPAGNTATWNITGTGSPGAKLYFATIDVDSGDTATLTDGTDPFAFSLLEGAYGYNTNATYTITETDTGAIATYNEANGILRSITSTNTSASAIWDVSGLSTVVWTPNSNGTQAMFFTVIPEPSSAALMLGLGCLLGVTFRRRRR